MSVRPDDIRNTFAWRLTTAKPKVEYRIVPQLLRDSNFKGKTTLKRIEPHRLRELMLEDLKLYGPSSIKDINTRIGEEIPRRTLSRAIKDLIGTKHVLSSGYGKNLKYEISRQFKSNKVENLGQTDVFGLMILRLIVLKICMAVF